MSLENLSNKLSFGKNKLGSTPNDSHGRLEIFRFPEFRLSKYGYFQAPELLCLLWFGQNKRPQVRMRSL